MGASFLLDHSVDIISKILSDANWGLGDFTTWKKNFWQFLWQPYDVLQRSALRSVNVITSTKSTPHLNSMLPTTVWLYACLCRPFLAGDFESTTLSQPVNWRLWEWTGIFEDALKTHQHRHHPAHIHNLWLLKGSDQLKSSSAEKIQMYSGQKSENPRTFLQ